MRALMRKRNGQRAYLPDACAWWPLGTYIRDLILADDVQAVRVRWRNPIKDHEALGRALAGLGQSRIANNLNQLAKAVNIGALPVTPGTEQEIAEVCGAVCTMCAGTREDGSIIEANDPHWPALREATRATREHPLAWLERRTIYSDLIDVPVFANAFVRWVSIIGTKDRRKHCRATLKVDMAEVVLDKSFCIEGNGNLRRATSKQCGRRK